MVVATPLTYSEILPSVTGAGQAIVGPSLSIVNVCVQLAVLPHSSVAVYVISYVAPLQPAEPEVNTGLVVDTVEGIPQEVLTTGVPSSISFTHCTVTSAGQVIDGPSFTIVNVCTQLDVL